jgi:thiol:disulfide interchange protein DsbD
LTLASNRLPAGRFAGVFAMGGVSALIVSPCVAAPLATALVFISQRGDVVLGGVALFALAMGMSVPLLVVGASAGALLPRAGAWMDDVKHFFGVVLLAVAIWTVQPVLPAGLALGLWGALLLGCAVGLAAAPGGTTKSIPKRAAAALLGVVGVMQLVGAASGGTDALKPLAHLARGRAPTPADTLAFQPVKTRAQLDDVLATAKQANRPVMLDFYADWCVSCKEMERFTFSDQKVRDRLSNVVLLKADVTQNDAADKELLTRFQLFGPPGTIFFDPQGQELTRLRVVGYQNTDRFLETLRGVGL